MIYIYDICGVCLYQFQRKCHSIKITVVISITSLFVFSSVRLILFRRSLCCELLYSLTDCCYRHPDSICPGSRRKRLIAQCSFLKCWQA